MVRVQEGALRSGEPVPERPELWPRSPSRGTPSTCFTMTEERSGLGVRRIRICSLCWRGTARCRLL
ncbi:4916_t:CDS:2, partial [Scutellospora calospora]